ncbi:MAG: thioredoxin family protein [Burkholderiales bacterium]|nr:thioredoxin family protein [Burkholderiales bacterium]
MSYLFPSKDAELIRCFLHEDRRLVACLCAAWCSSCRAWQADFLELAKNHPKDCFVWVDIEDHSDLVAEIDLETLPVLLIQDAESVHFLGPIQPRFPQVVNMLLMRNETSGDFPDPGLRDFLME